MIHPFRGVMPKVHRSAWIAGSADLIGDVELGEEASVWFSAVVRGDVNFIRVGRGTNVQDGAMVLDGAVLEEECIVAAGAAVSQGTLVPKGNLSMGAPARVKRSVTHRDLDPIYCSAKNYIGLAAEYRTAQGT